MKNRLYALIILLVLVLPLQGQNWTGNVNSDWNNPSNWSSWPLNGQDITIDPVNYTGIAASPVVFSNSVFVPEEVLMLNGAVLTIQANLTTNDNMEVMGTGTSVFINMGTLSVGPSNDGRFIIADGAVTTINNASLICGQRLIVELGAVFVQNNGLVNVAEVLAIADGNLTDDSRYEMKGGSLNVGMELGFENEMGNYDPSFLMTAGTLMINGDMVWFGEAPGAGRPRFIMTGGTATVTGMIMNSPLSTVDLFMHLGGNAVFNQNGMQTDLINTGDSILLSEQSVLNFNANMSWNNAGTVFASGGQTVFNGNTTLTGTGSYTFADMVINPLKSLIHLSPKLIDVRGNLMMNGNFAHNSNSLRLSGSQLQDISGTQASFGDLIVVNPSGVHLSTPATVTDSLRLLDGIIHSSATALLTLTDNATSTPGNSLSFVDGPIRKTGNDAFVFPTGKNGRWARIHISAPLSVASEFTAEYFDYPYSTLVTVNAPLMLAGNKEHWSLIRTGSSDAVQTGVFWEDASFSSLASCDNLALASYNGSSWDAVAANVSGACSGALSGNLSSLTALSSFGIFTIGHTPLTYQPLKDNTLYESMAGDLSNGAGDGIFSGKTNQNLLRRALLAFDVSQGIPAGAQLTSATLTLNVTQSISGLLPVGVHLLNADWGEGASVAGGQGGTGTTAQSDDATWLHTFYPSANWSVAGGDYNPNASASTQVGGNGVYSWSSPQMLSDVQSWMTSPSQNFGWMLVGAEQTTGSAKKFASRENPDILLRPVLQLFYELPCNEPQVTAISLSDSAVCAGSPLTVTVSGNLNQAEKWYLYATNCGGQPQDSSLTGQFVISPSSSDTWYVAGAGGCVQTPLCTSFQLTVIPHEDASFSYPQASVCENDMPLVPSVALTGGAFTAQPSGLGIHPSSGQIDPLNSLTGVYTITYTTAGPLCPSSYQQTLAVHPVYSDTLVTGICAGDTLYFNGQALFSDGYYTQILQSISGCDSIIILDLTVSSPDTGVTVSGITLTSAQQGAQWQWLDCGNGYLPIAGENQQTYTPAADGSYAVLVTFNGCSDTSSCIPVFTTSVDEKTSSFFSLWPNPAGNMLFIHAANVAAGSIIQIRDVSGKMIVAENIGARDIHEIDVSDLMPGLYFIQLHTPEGIMQSRFLKK